MTAKELLNKHIPNDEINFSVNSVGVGFFFIVIAILFLRISFSRIFSKWTFQLISLEYWRNQKIACIDTNTFALFLCHGNMLGNMQQLSAESFIRCLHCEGRRFFNLPTWQKYEFIFVLCLVFCRKKKIAFLKFLISKLMNLTQLGF